jgi:hypothetical protein
MEDVLNHQLAAIEFKVTPPDKGEWAAQTTNRECPLVAESGHRDVKYIASSHKTISLFKYWLGELGTRPKGGR